MTEAGVARRCLGAGVRDEVLVLITPILPGGDGGCPATGAGQHRARSPQPRPRAARDEPLAASSAKPFALTAHRPLNHV